MKQTLQAMKQNKRMANETAIEDKSIAPVTGQA
jgi:hypothetical protein